MKAVNGELSDKLWDWLDTEPACGAWNMATDQFFAETMQHGQRPIMRLYQWQPWCISLGIHQSADCVNLDKCQKQGIDVVRRQTGGRAVFHSEEITYSVILPRNHGFGHSVTETYHHISLGLAAGLRRLGVPASFQKRSVSMKSHYENKISMSCFSAAALHEIVVHGRKLVGSAQRRLQSGILQHGSVLVGSAHLKLFDYFNHLSEAEKEQMHLEMARKTTTVQEILECDLSIASIGCALKKGMEDQLGITFQNRELTSAEKQAIKNRQSRFVIYQNTS